MIKSAQKISNDPEIKTIKNTEININQEQTGELQFYTPPDIQFYTPKEMMDDNENEIIIEPADNIQEGDIVEVDEEIIIDGKPQQHNTFNFTS